MSRDTGPAKTPAIPPLKTQDPQLHKWASSVKEWIELRTGSLGNPAERAVTKRELDAITGAVQVLQQPKNPQPGEIVLDLGGGLTASLAIDRFVDAIRNTRLFRDLERRLDDPNRFDDIAAEVREILLRSIADEAAARGAEIRRAELLIQDTNRSLAAAVEEITASLQNNAAGIRETRSAFATASAAQAVKVTQLEASLGNFYQDGTPGRVSLEQQSGVFADRINGLRGQYTVKIQAGGAVAGFGLAASEVNGVPDSAFIIRADRFAVVTPNYNGGLTPNPASSNVPFGVDASGIYLNNNVYVRGTMRVDTGGRTLVDGMRGSLNLSISGSTWSDISARQAVWSALGRGGSALNNNHLVIGDTVTIRGTGNPPSFIETRYWTGSAWTNPGVVINGNLLVDGSLAAQKIDTRGLTIRDASGNVIFGAGVGLNVNQITGLGTLATQNSVNAGQVSGLGTLATRNDVRIGDQVRFADGSVLQTTDFVNRLSRITADNIGNFMNNAAIGTAYIGNAAVGTLQIAGQAVTIPAAADGVNDLSLSVWADVAMPFTVIGTFVQGVGTEPWRLVWNGVDIREERPRDGTLGVMVRVVNASPGLQTFRVYSTNPTGLGGGEGCALVVLGTKR